MSLPDFCTITGYEPSSYFIASWLLIPTSCNATGPIGYAATFTTLISTAPGCCRCTRQPGQEAWPNRKSTFEVNLDVWFMIDFFEKYTIFKKKQHPYYYWEAKKTTYSCLAIWWSQPLRLEGTSSACSDRFGHCERLLLVFRTFGVAFLEIW